MTSFPPTQRQPFGRRNFVEGKAPKALMDAKRMPGKAKRITIILGAGASAAYDRDRYPSLERLLPRMFAEADGLSGEGRFKLAHYLAYAMRTAYQVEGPSLEGRVSRSVIRKECACLRCLSSHLAEVFAKIEDRSNTRAYWAVTYAIGIYMFRVAEPNLRKHEAHAALARLIEAKLSQGIAVDVVDFNWDCLLERVWRSHTYQFGWDCGRDRRVIEGTGDEEELTLSEVWRKGHIRRRPWDEEGGLSTRVAGLIKPHGDRCTFLRGVADVAYCGGRHGQTEFALLPARLEDIGSDAESARISIIPPTHSRLRHTKHKFYDEEVCRLKTALSQSDTTVIIGWSASGADEWYGPIFNEAAGQQSRASCVRLIDWKEDDSGREPLKTRVRALFGEDTNLCAWWNGFSADAIHWLREAL